MNLWLLVALAVAVVLVSILWLRLHAFLALMLAALLVGVLTPRDALEDHAGREVAQGRMTEEQADAWASRSAPQRLADAFGQTAGRVGILIALASVIGACLLESGAAAVIVHRTLALVGIPRAPIAMVASSFLLGIPVFFDTVFYLMVPLAKSLRRRVGKDYVLFILAILAGGSIAHSLVPPTPGPLQVAEILGVDLLTLILAGLCVGAASSVLSLAAARQINRRIVVPLRNELGEIEEETEEGAAADEAPLPPGPPLWLALVPIVLPVVLIASATAWQVWGLPWVGRGAGEAQTAFRESLSRTVQVIGDKNVALAIAAALALGLLRWSPADRDRRQIVQRALASGGVVILITSAGGAFGTMLHHAGIAEAFRGIQDFVPGLILLPIAFLLTASIRTLQGSSTVSMITAAGILQGLAASGTLPFDPVYLALAIGAGSKPIAWMNDSGFWVMCKMSGMTESEGLRTVSPMSIALGCSALLWTLLGAWLLPMR